jgi:ParB-like chromosome segregation protein Spo0J
MDLRDLPLDDLVLDPDLNLRDKLDDATVERYAEAWPRLPAVTVYEVDGRWLLADGFHRHAAAVSLGKKTIQAEVRSGEYEDALDFAAGVNLSHGLPFNRNERRRAVEVKLRLHADWADRRLSEELGVSRDLVAKVRKGLVDAGQIPASQGRVGSDGKTYPATGTPRDPERPTNRAPRAEREDPRDRGGREADVAPWEERGPGRGAREVGPARVPADLKAIALAEMPEAATPTIDEMLHVMSRQIGELVAWTRSEGFAEALDDASKGALNGLRLAVHELVQRCEELEI